MGCKAFVAIRHRKFSNEFAHRTFAQVCDEFAQIRDRFAKVLE
jgi:hypothetical protein